MKVMTSPVLLAGCGHPATMIAVKYPAADDLAVAYLDEDLCESCQIEDDTQYRRRCDV